MEFKNYNNNIDDESCNKSINTDIKNNFIPQEQSQTLNQPQSKLPGFYLNIFYICICICLFAPVIPEILLLIFPSANVLSHLFNFCWFVSLVAGLISIITIIIGKVKYPDNNKIKKACKILWTIIFTIIAFIILLLFLLI